MARQIDPATGSLPASKGLSFTIPAPSNKDDLYDIDMNPQPKDQGLPYKTVVVMGATGFLGKADAQNAERQKYRQDSCNRSPTTSIQLAGNFLRPESTTAYGRPQRTATQPVQTSGPGDSQAVSSPTNPDALLRGKVDMVI
ncbi:hypothetical protein MGU_06748 [Metarhizium guizhouense ARSEF 977]|uniref:Uncharacterized protein n=1 Tax=Metarhizium guizhouense (strain ARSEF 977) TaxID=1276136 RepID=A0A0B4H8H6_METGA|nr:hypothetical protein MGU_06748 [Metarhizium guizhouense ARSEF 977]